jgi:glucose-6-phosphate 1-dehydrogenase
MAEKFGVGTRGRLYEELGAIRDVVQNHMLQVIVLLAMDAPVRHDSETMRDEKVRLFKAIRPLTASDVVRGQYRGYRETDGVRPDSQVETFAALRVHIDTWRWGGVPFYVRVGKELPVTATEVIVELKRPPQTVFDDITAGEANYVRFRLSPDVFISIGARVKTAGEVMAGEGTDLMAHRHSSDQMMPYERLLGDAMRGDPSLFAREDSVEAAWGVLDPILGAASPVYQYEPGTWGPPEANQIISGQDVWQNPAEGTEA